VSPGQPPTLSSRRARARLHARAHPHTLSAAPTAVRRVPPPLTRPHLSSAAAPGRSAVHIAILGRHPRRPRTWGRRPDRDARRAEPSTSRRATSRGSAPSSAPQPPDLPPTSPRRTTGTCHPRSQVHPSQPTPPPTRTAATAATSRRHPATSSGTASASARAARGARATASERNEPRKPRTTEPGPWRKIPSASPFSTCWIARVQSSRDQDAPWTRLWRSARHATSSRWTAKA